MTWMTDVGPRGKPSGTPMPPLFIMALPAPLLAAPRRAAPPHAGTGAGAGPGLGAGLPNAQSSGRSVAAAALAPRLPGGGAAHSPRAMAAGAGR